MQAASVLTLSQWSDTFLFQVAVAHVFKPANLAHMFGNSAETLEAFTKDRAAMRVNATTRRLSSLEAMAAIQTFLTDFERQLGAGARFAVGDALSVADFSIYHCLWFMRRAPSASRLIEPFANVVSWMNRIAAFGHGTLEELSSTDAVKIAREAKPLSVAHPQDAGDIRVGDPVEVLPTDYGIDPTPGTLVNCTLGEIAIRRVDPRATDVVVHFPRLNYELRKASS